MLGLPDTYRIRTTKVGSGCVFISFPSASANKLVNHWSPPVISNIFTKYIYKSAISNFVPAFINCLKDIKILINISNILVWFFVLMNEYQFWNHLKNLRWINILQSTDKQYGKMFALSKWKTKRYIILESLSIQLLYISS